MTSKPYPAASAARIRFPNIDLTMKLMSFSSLLKFVCLLGALAVCGKASADNRLVVDDFTISSYDVKQVAVNLENSDEIAGLDFTLILPEGIELEGVERTDRYAPSQQIYTNYMDDEACKILVVSLQPNRNFSGNEGPVLLLNLQAQPGVLLRNREATLELHDITLTNGNGSQAWTPADVEANVTLLAGEFEVTAQEAAYVVKPEVATTVALGLDNSADVSGFQADIVVPEGFKIDENSFKLSDRCVSGILPVVYPQADGVTTRVIIYNMAGGNVINLPVPGATSNDIFTFDVTAPASFVDAHAEVVVKNVVVTALGNQTFDAGTATINLENGKVPYDAAAAEVARLRKALEDALATIATEAPDVKDDFTGSEIAASIDALEAAINTAYENGTPAAGYESLLKPVPGIEEAIAKLVADAKAAQEAEDARKAANEKAYKADLETIAGLQDQLDAAVAEISEKYPAFDVDEAKKAAQDAIDEAKAAADAAYEAVANEGEYTNTVDSDAIKAAIDKLLADAETSGIDSILVEVESGNASVYNLQGVKISAPAKGQMNIIVDKSGNAYKVVVK